MKKKTTLMDKTKLFLGLQEEALAGQKSPSVDIRIHLDQAAEDLSTYFENPNSIPTALGAGGLRYEHAFLQQNRSKPWIDQNLRIMLAEFRTARNNNANICFQTWGSWMEAIDRSTRNVAVVAFLQEDLEKLNSEFMAKSILRDIGDILEGSLQPLACLRLEMQRIAGMRTKTAKPIKSMTFGKIIEELASRQVGGSIYCPQPFGITVSQWRNIANHNSYVVEGDSVICTYGKSGNFQKIFCPVDSLIDLGVYVNDLGFMHKIAYEIFSIDNLKDLTPYAPDVEITDHTRDGALAYGLVAAGFTIVKVGYKPGVWILGLIDRFERSEFQAKSALQTATITYILLTGSVEVFALVKSGTSIYKFGFQSKTADSKSETFPDSAANLRHLDQYWRPILDKNSSNDSQG